MTRHRYRFDPTKLRSRPYPPFPDGYNCEWGFIVGDRIRRLRRARDWSLVDLCQAVEKPDGGQYTPSFFSRLERGWASGPLATYVNVAFQLGVEPGRLLGPDAAQLEASESEMTLIRLIRRMGLAPDEAIARLAGIDHAEPGLAG
jgi:transcriptional regulator with XRE-family HTH domain